MSKRHLIPLLLLFAYPLPAAAVVHIEVLEAHRSVGDHDFRPSEAAPLPGALALAAHSGWQAEWNRYGTVHTLQNPGGFLATGLSGDPETAARAWLKQNRVLFRLEHADIDALEVMREGVLNQSGVAVFLFRQTARGLPVAHDGRIKMAIAGDRLVWVASSSVGSIGEVPVAAITPADAWLAAINAVPPLAQLGITAPPVADFQEGWALLGVDAQGFDPGFQRTRRGLLALPGSGVRPVFEANVVRSRGSTLPHGDVVGPIAYTAYVDAVSSQVWMIQDRVQQMTASEGDNQIQADPVYPFTGSYPPGQTGECGPCHGPYTVEEHETYSSVVITTIAVDDTMIDLYRNEGDCSDPGALVAHHDLLFGVEVMTYEPAGGVLPGDYFVNICPYDPGLTGNYTGTISFTEVDLGGLNTNPKWRHFAVTPEFDHSDDDTRILGCWRDNEGGVPVAGCDDGYRDGSSHGIAWDAVTIPSLTTAGNNAKSQEAWEGALVGAGAYSPVSATREYDFDWTNAWFNSECDPAAISHASALHNNNDIDAAVVNLFVQHNRLHDYAYHLGLVETWGVAQTYNYGETGPTREYDPEIGMAQASAHSGGAPAYVGRDNANQITLQDGIAPITNMYLWQTIGGAAYAPCVDGDFDSQIIAHEYGHLIQNRMTDPDSGLGGLQGRSMGEGWADLTSVMLFDELDVIPDGEPHKFSVGAYVTGDVHKGIRNYSMADSPLMFSDVGYDFICSPGILDIDGNCPEEGQVHADSEPWTAVLFDLRQALMDKYDVLGFSSSDGVLKLRCGNGEVPVDFCPGQRRWSQLIHDGFVLQPSTPTMLNARDAIIAADLARANDPGQNWPSNQELIWRIFARRGFGGSASIPGPASTHATGGWDSPLGGNVEVTFDLRDLDGNPVIGDVYIGQHEARSTPAADTDPDSGRGNTLSMQPGAYEVLVRADGFGHTRFDIEVAAGLSPQTLSFGLAPNLASLAAGAVATGDGDRLESLIDETEYTNWESLGNNPSVDVVQPAVTVALAGGTHEIARVQVSAMLQLQLGQPTQNRWSALHEFALAVCDADTADCGQDGNYTEVGVTPEGTFSSSPFRPIITDTMLRQFTLAEPVQASHVRITALHNKCTGTPFYHGYLGEPGRADADESNHTDCRVDGHASTIGARIFDVRIAEFQVFGQAPVAPVEDHIFSDRFEP